ncbi:glycerate kinase [Microbacteriaceae bacterium 4G12]
MMNYLIAVDSFKDSLSSLEAGQALQKGILSADSLANIQILAMADGGEGTVDALLHANKGTEITVSVSGPLMEPTTAKYAVFETNGEEYVFIECAQSSGLPLVPYSMRNPMKSNTYGLGEQIKDAIQRGYRNFILSLGGSATNDAGIGMLQALGWEFYDKDGALIEISGNPLLRVHRIVDTNIMPELAECTFTVASDVMNPFYGPNGAAFVFAPQKGATAEQVEELDKAMEHFAKLIHEHYQIDVQKISGSGAAGGLGGALTGGLQAKIESGAELVMKLIRLEEYVKNADIVITGEGSLDQQSIMGKVPVGVAKLAKKHHKTVIGIGGRMDTNLHKLNEYLDAVFSIQTQCRTLEEALLPEVASLQLKVTVEQIVKLINQVK